MPLFLTVPLPTHNYHRSCLNALFHSSLRLTLLALHVLVCTKGKTGTDEDDCIKADTQACRIARRSGRRGHCCNLRFWVSLLKVTDQQPFRIKGRNANSLTLRFKLPTSRPSRISRASSLCPTSSNASVASCPPTSSRTSSPPLNAD